MKFETDFNYSRFQQYTDSLKANGTSQSTVDRKLSSLNSFQNFLIKKGYLNITYQKTSSISSSPPKNFLGRYLIFGTLIAIILGLGYGLYSQTILKAKSELAYSTASNPVSPSRVLSFQGRLTDTSGNPITSPTDIVFKFYNASVGGTELYASSIGNSQTITPDENGIFSVVIGKSHGTEIPPSVFSENAEVWLEITADSEIMDPRQQIATVAYALNSETLQGLEPSASGLKNTVLVIDGSGNLNLGETSPTIISNSGTLGLIGQAILIGATDGSGGNITINPDGNGTIRFLTEGTTPSSGGFIDLVNANITSGNLINSQINNENRAYNFLSFQNYNVGTTTLATRFSIDASGNVYISDSLSLGTTTLATNLNANYLNGYSYNNLPYDNYQYWQLQTNGIGTTNINSQSLVNLIGGTGISLSQTGSSITITSSGGIGTTYAAGLGLTLSDTNIFSLDLASTNTWTGVQTFSNNFNVGSSALITNLNANYLNSHPDTYFVNVGQTNVFIQSLTNGGAITITGTDIGRTLAVDYNTTNLKLTANQLNTIQDITTTSDVTFNNLTLGGTLISVGDTSLVTNLNANYLNGYAYDNLPYEVPLTFNNGLTRTINTIGLGGTLVQNTNLTIGNTSALFINGTSSYIGIGTSNPAEKLSVVGNITLNGRVYGGTGSVSYPSFTPGDTDTGMYGPTSNTIGFSIGGSDAVRIDSSGSVGIGTTSPTQKLDVNGAVNIGSSLTIGTNLTIGGTFISVGDTSLVTNLNANYLNGYSYDGLPYFNTASNGLTAFSANSIGLGGTLTQDTQIGTSSFSLSFLGLGNTQSLFISSSGNVGIGTTNPTDKVQTTGNFTSTGGGFYTYNLGTPGATNSEYLRIFPQSNIYFFQGIATGTGTGRDFQFYSTGAGYLMRIKASNGNVGIGNTAPFKKLDIVGDINLSGTIFVGGGGTGVGTTGSNGQVLASDGSGGLQWITSTGGVGSTYAAGLGLTLSDTNIFSLDLASTNTWTGVQTFSNNFNVGSSALITNLNANYLNGYAYDNLPYVNNTTDSTLTRSSTGPYTLGLNLDNANTWTGAQTFANITVGGTFISVGDTSLVTNLNANYLNGYAYDNLPYESVLTFNNGLTRATNTIGLGGTLLQNTEIGTSSFTLSFLGLGNTQSLYINSLGNVGIGTTSPNGKFEVSSGNTGVTAGEFLVDTINKTVYVGRLSNTGGDNSSFIVRNRLGNKYINVVTGSTTDYTAFGVNTGEVMRINATGNVGIGTSTPTQKLDINGSLNIGASMAIGSSQLVTNLNADLLDGYHSTSFLTDLTAGIGITITGTGQTRNIAFDGTQIGNMTFGSGSTFTWTFDAGATDSFINFNNGFIGIGTTSNPRTALEVNGTIAAQKIVDLTSYDQYFLDLANSDYESSSLALDRRGSIKWNALYSSGWTTIDNGSASNIENHLNGLLLSTSIGTTTASSSITGWNQNLFLSNNGNVGIGTTDPQARLEIANSTSTITNVSGDITISAASGSISLNSNSLTDLLQITAGSGSNSVPTYSFSSDTNTGMYAGGVDILHFATAGSNHLTINASGYVGIGTTNPGNKLSIVDTSAPNDNYNTIISAYGIGITAGNSSRIVFGVGSTNMNQAELAFYYAGNTSVNNRLDLGLYGNSQILSLKGDGNVGIGTTAPTNKLSVVGNADFSSNVLISTNLNVGGTSSVNDLYSSGYVGIGTTAPGYKLDVQGTGTSGIAFFNNTTSGTGYTQPTIVVQTMNTGLGTTGAQFIRFINNSGAQAGRIHYNTSTTTITYGASATADFAEYVISDEPTFEGDLISFSNNKYTLSSLNKPLAGIHSSSPTFTGNENISDQTNAFPLAMAGVVKLKVNTENGLINSGDPLTASSIPGVATKAITAGQIAARAINSYSNSNPSEIGLIEVIANLSWYDPDVFISSNGQIAVNFNISDTVLTSLGYSSTKNEIENATYSLTDSTGKLITSIGQFAQVTAAKITAGLVSAKNIIADNLAAKKIASETIITGDITATTATISGTLTTSNLVADEATFSTVYADQIINPEGNISDVMSQKISSLRDEIKNIIASNQAIATPSAIMADASIWDTSLATNSADLTLDNLTLNDNLVVGAMLTVNGQTKLNSANVSDILTVGQIALSDNILETTADNLYFQPSGSGTIHFLNDRLVLASDGSVTINGNVKINGSLVATLLQTDTIETKNLTAEKVNIAVGETTSSATSSANLASNATVGTVTLASGQTEISITNSQLTASSMVYLTPNSSTQNQVPYLKNKSGDTFTIAIDQPLDHDVNINWWLIN